MISSLRHVMVHVWRGIPVLSVLLLLSFDLHAKTYIREYTYTANPSLDTEQTARTMALERVKTDLLEEIGVYIRSKGIRVTSEVGGKFGDSYKREMFSLTAGITQMKVLDERWDGTSYYAKAQITVDEEQFREALRGAIENEDLKRDLRESQEEVRLSLTKIESLKMDIGKLTGELAESRAASEKIKREYARTVDRIGSEQLYQEATYLEEVAGDAPQAKILAGQAVKLNANNKRAQNLLSTIQSWQMAILTLENRSAVPSRVVINYRFATGVDQYSATAQQKNFNIEYDILPLEQVKVQVHSNVTASVIVHNDIYKQKREQKINSGNRYLTTIDATPPGAKILSESKDATVQIRFNNRSTQPGEVIIVNKDRIGSNKAEPMTIENAQTVRIERKAPRVSEQSRTIKITPQTSKTVGLMNGIYYVTLSAGRGKKEMWIQIANGRAYDKKGNLSPRSFDLR